MCRRKPIVKNEAESTFKVMRIYPRDKDGVVDYEKNYTTELIDPTKPFPKGTFVISSDYAIEDQNGSLKFLNKVRLYKDKEYCEFFGQKQYEKHGDIIWSR